MAFGIFAVAVSSLVLLFQVLQPGKPPEKLLPTYFEEAYTTLTFASKPYATMSPEAYVVKYRKGFITPQNPAVVEVAASVSQNIESKIERAIRTFDYVAQLRYDESILWNKPDETIRLQAGDCQSKSSLLVSMLRSTPIGFDENEVWQVHTPRHTYVILRIENVWLPLDPTNYPPGKFWHFGNRPEELNDLRLYYPWEIFNDVRYSDWSIVMDELRKMG